MLISGLIVIRVLLRPLNSKVIYSTASYFFFIMFAGMWMSLGFPHQMTMIYSFGIVTLIIYTFERKVRALSIGFVVCVYLVLLLVDVYYRYDESLFGVWSLSRIFGTSAVWLGVATTVYVHQRAYETVYDKLQVDNRLDPMTSAYNNRALNEDLRRANETSRQFCIAYIDLDDFKMINDTYGHMIGDNVLSQCVKMFRSELRSTDKVYRVGGDEFIIKIDDITESLANKKIKMIFDKTDDYFDFPFDVKFSYGIVSSDQWSDGSDVDEMIRLADELMYKFKSGRGVEAYRSEENHR